MPPSAPVTIRWVSSFADIPQSPWDQCFPPPLEGRWWYAALERCGIEDQFKFAYAVIDRGGETIGIAPTFLMDVPLDIIAPEQIAGLVRIVGRFVRFLRYQRTLFVGSPCSDEGTVGLIPGVTLNEVAGPLQDALDERAKQTKSSMIVWKDFVDADVPSLAGLVESHGLFRVTSYPGTRISDLSAGGFESYLKSLKSSHRHNLKKKLRRGKEALATEPAVNQNPDPQTIDEIFALFWQTYLKGKTKFERLNRRFFELIAGEPTSYFALVRRKDNGRLVAFMLCFDCEPRAINKFIGIDYAVEDAYLYFQLWEVAVDWASRRGFREFQSGQTGYRAKFDVGHEPVRLTNFCRHRNWLVQKIFAWQAKSISWETIDGDLKTYVAAHSAAP
jgi:predicted N-acyltransferase